MNTPQDLYQYIYRKTMEKKILFFCEWELTQRCNLKCSHCYLVHSNIDVPFSFAKRIIRELKTLGCLYLTFTGGEIFLHPDFFKIALYARKHGFALRLLSNLTLLDSSKIKELIYLYPLSIETSIYSYRDKFHDQITGLKGSFRKTMRAISSLRKNKLKVVLKFLIRKDNFKEFHKVKKLASDVGADFLYDFCIVKRKDNSSLPLEYRLNQEEIREFFIRYKAFPEIKETDQENSLLCSAGLNNLFLGADLEVYPCVGLNYRVGSLKEKTLTEIWNSKELEFIRNLDVTLLYRCSNCHLKRFCFRCMGLSLSEGGNLLGPANFNCQVAEIVFWNQLRI
ncbi:MAG: radical SAM protein [Candidatus Omnitrophica bacterium]|nr:radical SAM protein [Candidatus Omnitrophota bacterium]